tara:strand:- start:1916 stop:2920 length:1005 start_codon:yes stop_codon:yes gene_type:complete
MSEDNKDFDEFLNKKEQEGGAFDNKDADTTSEKDSKDVDPIEETINKEGLGSVNMSRFSQDKAEKSDFHLGYHSLDMNTLFSKGKFYPQDTKISIRAAKVAEIRHFSTMMEDNLFDIEEKLNGIVKGCARIESPTKKLSYKDLLEEDRIAVILAVRDLTFPEPENKLMLKAENSYGVTEDVELATKNLAGTTVPEEIEKYYDAVARCYRVQTRSAGEILMRPPSIGVMEIVTKYIREQQEQKKKWDQAFIQILPYVQLDWRGFNTKEVFNQEVAFQGWNEKKYMIMYRLAEKMKIGAQAEMEVDVDGEMVKLPLDFPGGIKSLFIISDLAGELL